MSNSHFQLHTSTTKTSSYAATSLTTECDESDTGNSQISSLLFPILY